MDISTLRIVAFAAACATAFPAQALQSCRAASGPQALPLVELYTSQGCDSCPPADRWLTKQFPAAATDARAVALAFHVDYWDRLGWKDRFATPQYTQRQYDAMRANRASFVYTPQVLVQGREALNWQQGGATDAIAAAAGRAARAAIALTATSSADALQVRAIATVPYTTLRKQAVLWLAYTDSGHVTEVAAGENRGLRLHHDHVVRSLHGPYPVDTDGTAVAELMLVPQRDDGHFPVLVAFVQDSKRGDALQTLELPACW